MMLSDDISGWKPEETDIGLYNYTILRMAAGYVTLISLTSGVTIKIPYSWFDLFSSLNTWGGHRILLYKEKPMDNVSRIIHLGFYMIYYYSQRKSKEFISVLSEICKVGTAEFREWILEEFGKTLMPIEFRSIDRYEEL